MKGFSCNQCGGRLHFENTGCLACGATAGFLPQELVLAALEPAGGGVWRRAGAAPAAPLWRMCRNYEQHHVCNWMVPADGSDAFCPACAPNRTIPDLTVARHRELWAKLEAAKRRLVYTLLRLGLPVVPKTRDPAAGLAFEFLADPDPGLATGPRVMTGHLGGVITVNLAEADDAAREQLRLDLHEGYRTLLGHLRHESGHFYWERLVRDHPRIDAVRAVFGDEREDYATALQRHYARPDPDRWLEAFVTPYAAVHPWEDWAETWAHVLHILDTLETAAAYGVELRGPAGVRRIEDPFPRQFTGVLDDWHALRLVLNSLNRSMGLKDGYPFVISPTAARKMTLVREWLWDAPGRRPAPS